MLTTGIDGGLLTTSGILTNEANVGFEVPEGQSKYLTAGNDVVDLSKWNGTGSVNIGDAFSSDNDKVTVMANALAGAVAKDNLKLTSVENLEIVNSGVKTPVTLTGANFKGLEVVKLIGDATTLDVSSFTQGVKIDATANADTITGSDKADTINGGAGNDIITGNDGNDVLTGGNGADEFVVGTVKAAGIDQILDFSAEDKITMKGFSAQELKKFDASTFSTVTYKTLDSVLATFRSGGANVTKDGDFVIFSYDGKTYALLANGAGFREDNDALVDITGANVASLTESNFGIRGAFANYADFKAAVGSGEVTTPTTIKSITANDAAALLTTEASNLALIEDGGIGAVTGDPVTVTMNATTLNASTFAAKLSTNVLLNINSTFASGTTTITSPLAGNINCDAANDTITVTAATGAVNINGGAGDDKIYVSGSANATINGGSGADTIDASTATDAVTIEGGAGNDTISLGAGADVVKFTLATAGNENNITNFTVSGTKLDKLSFDTTEFDGFSAAANTITDVSSATNVDTSNNTAIFRGTLDNLKTYLKAKAAVDNTKVVIAIATDVGNEGIYSVTLSHTGGSSAQASDIVKVGTLDVVNLSTLTIDNFIAGV